ncbi:MAG: hypothetical protein A2076_00025 [Geobacteraceae bacterium GWC2_53_11]|nr:MAG: hypothetical protein A2076_00025 [Geobacteraceae bacterium GWC2_53_11]
MKKTLILFVVLSLLVYNVFDAFAGDVEKALFHDLSECSGIVKRIAGSSRSGGVSTDDIGRLKKCSEPLQADRLLLAERQGTVAERATTLGSQASDRQGGVSSALIRNLDGLLNNLDTFGANSTSSDLDVLQRLLDTLVPKRPRPLLGALPYKHTNYPSHEPISSPIIKPAYKGGDRSVYVADTAASPEAPLSREIVELAQSLQWNPVLIYEWVKNNVETEWYWGSMKGAEETLRQKSGNDADQASLLVALLRASNFPARYVRGTIDFFPEIERAKNLTGLDDPAKIVDFFRKAGIPSTPVISGGGITNLHIEHVWVEVFIPYANYRGAVVDDQGKIWLGLDTSIKPRGYTRTTGAGVSSTTLATLWDDYLNTVQAASPLDYLTGKLDEQLAGSQPGTTWTSLKDSATLIPDVLKIIPDSMQFNQIAVTGEYQSLPDELKHKLTFTATAGSSELFSITLDTHKLSSSKIALRAEPETVEDQNTIDSFGGLDNTPAYLVRLRPVLTLDGERLIVAQDGLPMGADFTLNIDVITPNGTERISSGQINGNLSVIGVVADKAQTPVAITQDDDAETILHKEALRYIDRWNKAEEELAGLLGQRISRPTVTVATVGGQMAVTTLLDITHDMQWQGLYLDAEYKRIETTGRNGQEREFMRLSALQGSVLENRIFEDDLKVDSVSTAKLLQLAKASGTSILTIDKISIDTILPTLSFDDAVKADIVNAVNQNLTVTIPQNEVVYQDWSGIGYIKENTETGESGWILSGNVAGGMTAAIEWVNNYLKDVLASYGTKPSNEPAAKIIKITAVDQQSGIVGTGVKQKLAVLITDKNGRPVKAAKVTFKIVAGGGTITTAQPVTSSFKGIAAIDFTLGKMTSDNPIYTKLNPLDPEVTQIGLNLVTASLETGTGTVELADSFSSYARPDVPVQLVKMFGDNASNVANNPAGSLQAKVVDQYGNPVSNLVVQFDSVKMELDKNIPQYGAPAPLPADARPLTFYKPDSCSVAYPIYGECSTQKTVPRVSGYAGCFINTILGDTVNTKYTVDVTTPGFPSIDKVSFTVSSEGYRSIGEYLPHSLLLRYLEQFTSDGHLVNATKAGTKLTTPLTAELLVYTDEYKMESAGTCNNALGTAYPCWQIIPSGKTTMQKVPKGKGTVAFNVTTGGGKVSATRDMDNGKFEADFTAGPEPERNQITVSGSARITVPEVLYDTDLSKVVMTGYPADNIPMRDVELPINNDILFKKAYNATGSHDQITRQTETLLYYTVFSVDTLLNMQPCAIAITKDGKAKRDTTFTYTIAPADYTAIISAIDFFTKDPLTSNEEWAFQLYGDKTQGIGTSTMVAGSQWDIHKKYSARVTLNNGSAIEIDGKKMPVDILLGALVPDYNHDRKIDAGERDRTESCSTNKYYFWVNDDDGNGDTEGSGIPGSGSAIDPSHLKVDGTRDLTDFFPVHLDIKELFEQFDPAAYTYRLRNADSALNYVVTDLKPTESGGYLTGENKDDATGAAKGIAYVQSLANAPTTSITDTGFSSLTTPYLQLKPEVIQQIKQDKGVILVEAHKKTTSPLVLEIYKGTTLVYSSLKLNLSIDGVEQMFRHKNLVEAGDGPSQKSIYYTGTEDRLIEPLNFPDSESNGKNFVFVHGYNVNPQQARGTHAEIFKRMYWSGSKAKFWGITWYGYHTQIGSFTPDYHVNVPHALVTAPYLRSFLNSTVQGEITIAAHSLGNMVLSSMLSDNAAGWDNNYLAPIPTTKIKNYFMIDAAVAIEAYDDGASQSDDMRHSDWINYKKELWASEWHQLYVSDSPKDNRANLTWRGRFNARPKFTDYYNFYSSGEEVLATLPINTPLTEILKDEANQLGTYAWALQEKLKGANPITVDIAGSSLAGWGFNLEDYAEKDPFGKNTNNPISFFLANDIPNTDLKTKPFFKKGSDADLYAPGSIGSTYAANNMNRLLGSAIPALTLPAGANTVETLGAEEVFNFNMEIKFKKNKNWPKIREPYDNWKHSDLKNVSYPFVYSLFDTFVSLGGLK